MFARVFSIRTVLVALWLLGIGASFAAFLKYQNTAGDAGSVAQHWPAGTQIAPDPQRDTLIMFAHPQCPCTRASIEELNRLLAQAEGRVAAQVFFLKPEKSSEDWSKTDLWRSAAAIPGVTVREDLEGAQARLFGAETSGYVLLYDTRGQLLFQGGITGSRGHAGDNAGESAILSLLAGHEAKLEKTPVYGCSLMDEVCSREGAAQ